MRYAGGCSAIFVVLELIADFLKAAFNILLGKIRSIMNKKCFILLGRIVFGIIVTALRTYQVAVRVFNPVRALIFRKTVIQCSVFNP